MFPRNLPRREGGDQFIPAPAIFVVLAMVTLLSPATSFKPENTPIPLAIKGHGIMDLHKGDVALVLYVTVSSLGHEPLSLSVVGRTCCLEVTATDADCDSMLLVGGDMGDIYPGDNRNLTVFYPNLYLIDRVGYCEVEIAVPDGTKIVHTIYFNTTVPRTGVNVPHYIKGYSNPTELKTCKSPDLDPERSCKPVLCDVKYNGVRNFFNKTTQRCEPTVDCWNTIDDDIVYLATSNACRRLEEALSDEDMDFFEKDSETAPVLRTLHGYPIKVNCHNGRPDPTEDWCVCEPGWESDPLDYTSFNPDYMVYHMCTVLSPEKGQGRPQKTSSKKGGSKMKRGDQKTKGIVSHRRDAPLRQADHVGYRSNETWYIALVSKHLETPEASAIIVPILAFVVVLLSSFILAIVIYIVAECQKVRRIPKTR